MSETSSAYVTKHPGEEIDGNFSVVFVVILFVGLCVILADLKFKRKPVYYDQEEDSVRAPAVHRTTNRDIYNPKQSDVRLGIHAGYQCTAGYPFDNVSVREVGYCKRFDSSFLFSVKHIKFGKYFANHNVCYVLTRKEEDGIDYNNLGPFEGSFRSSYSVNIVTLDTDRFMVLEPNMIRNTECSPIPFYDNRGLQVQINGTWITMTNFSIARATVPSPECKNHQRIPALYNLDYNICLYGAGVGQPIRTTKTCFVICDTTPKEDIWYFSN